MFPESLKAISKNVRLKSFRELPNNGGVYYPLERECPVYHSDEGIVRTNRALMVTVGSNDLPDEFGQDKADQTVYEQLILHVGAMREHGDPKIVFLKDGPGVIHREVRAGRRHHWINCVIWAEEKVDGS